MDEIAPGLFHWTARRQTIGADVHCHYLAAEGVLVDPMVPDEGLEWLERHGPPAHVLLTNHHHDRDAWRLREAFGCAVHCARAGLGALEGRGPVEPFDFGQELPGGVVAHEVGAFCPDETALHFPAQRALACGDAVVRGRDGGLAFVPDRFMDEPERTKAGLREAFRRLVALDFEVLLMAHGAPLVGGARDALRAFAG